MGGFGLPVGEAAVFAGRLEAEVAMNEVTRDELGVEAGNDFADAHVEGSGDERNPEAQQGSGAFDKGGFGCGIFELEEVHAEVENRRDEEAEKLETEISEGNAKVEIVELIEAEPHEGGAGEEDGEELVSIFDMFDEIKIAMTEVDF